MPKTELKGLEFDPGFAPYILAFTGSVEYIYLDINKFKNLSQKKMKFMQYHKKILELFNNNLGFYVGCLMWAAYLKTQPEQEILSNHCFGKEYNEEENKADTQFMLEFTKLFPKDMKYYLGKNYEFESNIIKLLETYEEFLALNKGFVNTKTNSDLVLPTSVKTENAIEYKTIIENILKTEDLSLLLKELPTIL
ncbi:hypothetical protein IJD34_09605 [bacterium]|nr:hypothetical protein [bacterium]